MGSGKRRISAICKRIFSIGIVRRVIYRLYIKRHNFRVDLHTVDYGG